MPTTHLIRNVVAELPSPLPTTRGDALQAALTEVEHHRLASEVAAFGAIEQHPASDLPPPAILNVAAWNAERLKFPKPSVRLVEQSDADVLFLTEADFGMARSGNRHTTADLAAELGMGFVYGVEFLELGLGDERERAAHADEANRLGYHGNALLTRMPLEDAFLLRIDDGAVWWLDAEKGQQRLGWRMAIGGRIVMESGPVWLVSVHLESKTTPADRTCQVRRLLEHVEALSEGGPVAIGGDFNTKLLIGTEVDDWLADPAGREPLFAEMQAAGFSWAEANTSEDTTRTRPDGAPTPPHKRLDWLFTRGLSAENPRTLPAVDEAGDAISDHDLVAARLRYGA